MSLLALAFVSGLVMAGIRFTTDRQSAPWLPKLHGYAAIAALALLGRGWASQALAPAASFGVLALVVAAVGGITLNLRYHWKARPLPEWLVFAHMSVAFIGVLFVGMATLSQP